MRAVLSNYEEEYPNLTDDHYYRAVNLIERKQSQLDKETFEQQKAVYNTGAKEAFDRWELWTTGKRGPDKTGFEEWLEKARTEDKISEKTYESYTRGIANEKTRQAYEKHTGNVIATLGNWQTYQTILGGIKDGSYDLNEVLAQTATLPKGMRNELMKLASSGKPEDKAKTKGLQYLLKKGREMELDADGMQELKEDYELKTKDAKVGDMMDIAKELSTGIEDNSMKAR